MKSTPAQTDAKPSSPAQAVPLLFEVAWEVCSQVGGIYTVLRSKAPAAVRRWGDGYWLIGPYRPSAAQIEFESPAPTGVVGEVVSELLSRRIGVHCGRWLITGRPQVLLIDVHSVYQNLGNIKYFYWKDVGIGSADHDFQADEILAFGHIVADLLMEMHKRLKDRPMLAHFHEWQGGAALPLLRHRKANFPTVFTTHATLVGRSLSASNVALYDHLPNINGEAVANQNGFGHRFRIEKAAAHAADVFTTVSDITSFEAEQFLGRKPDALTPNGLNVERYAAPYEFQNLHRKNKDLIHEFVMGHFFPSYTFDLDRTLYIFTAGRYEFRNKGFDVFIEALYELNKRLKAEPTGVTVVAFIIAPAPSRALNVATLNSQAMFNELRNTCDSIQEEMGRRLFHSVAGGRLPELDDLLNEYDRVRLKRMMHAWQQEFQPAIVTHDLVDDANDPVLCHLRHRNLLNAVTDPVKVVFHPEFITSTSPLLGLEYDQFVRGCNMGVFPSYYEPWGYTPMECVIRGIPAIASDLSGFGAYVTQHFPDHNTKGLYVAQRRGVGFGYTVWQVTNWLYGLTRMSRRDRINLRNETESYAEHFDWSNLASYYRTARRMAFSKYYPDLDILPPEAQVLDAASSSSVRTATRRRSISPAAPGDLKESDRGKSV